MKCFDAASKFGARAFNKLPEMLENEHFMMYLLLDAVRFQLLVKAQVGLHWGNFGEKGWNIYKLSGMHRCHLKLNETHVESEPI